MPEQIQKLETHNMETRYWLRGHSKLEVETNIHQDFISTEKAPARAFSWLKVSTSAIKLKTLLRHVKSTYVERKPDIGIKVKKSCGFQNLC